MFSGVASQEAARITIISFYRSVKTCACVPTRICMCVYVYIYVFAMFIFQR